jgi:hypothetical protein
MENQLPIKTSEDDLLERIRLRPSMFFGTRSLSGLRHFFAGYCFAYHELGIKPPDLVPDDIHDWVAYRLHFRESTLGYLNMILTHTADEAEALNRFFELLDEHRARKRSTVATIRRHPKDLKITRTSGVEIPHADEVSIVVFTNDPGFFLMNDNPACAHPRRSFFYPSLSWLREPYKPDPEFTTILDQGQFDRLGREKIDFERQLREEAEIRRLKVTDQDDKID